MGGCISTAETHAVESHSNNHSQVNLDSNTPDTRSDEFWTVATPYSNFGSTINYGATPSNMREAFVRSGLNITLSDNINTAPATEEELVAWTKPKINLYIPPNGPTISQGYAWQRSINSRATDQEMTRNEYETYVQINKSIIKGGSVVLFSALGTSILPGAGTAGGAAIGEIIGDLGSDFYEGVVDRKYPHLSQQAAAELGIKTGTPFSTEQYQALRNNYINNKKMTADNANSLAIMESVIEKALVKIGENSFRIDKISDTMATDVDFNKAITD